MNIVGGLRVSLGGAGDAMQIIHLALLRTSAVVCSHKLLEILGTRLNRQEPFSVNTVWVMFKNNTEKAQV